MLKINQNEVSMTIKELAAKLNGREYGNEISEPESNRAAITKAEGK